MQIFYFLVIFSILRSDIAIISLNDFFYIFARKFSAKMQTSKTKKEKSEPKKKISYYQRQKAIMELSRESNRNMTLRFFIDKFGEK